MSSPSSLEGTLTGGEQDGAREQRWSHAERLDSRLDAARCRSVLYFHPLRVFTRIDACHRTYDINVKAHYYTIKAFLPEMLQQKHGHIIVRCFLPRSSLS